MKKALYCVVVLLLLMVTGCSDSDSNTQTEEIYGTTLSDLKCLKYIVDNNTRPDSYLDWDIDLDDIENPKNYKLYGVTWDSDSKRVVGLVMGNYYLDTISLNFRPLTALRTLEVTNEQMSKILLPATSTLKNFVCKDNDRMTELVDVSKNPNLTFLYLSNNKDLYTNTLVGGVLDITNNTKLENFYCDFSSVTDIKMSYHPNLRDFSAFDCDIPSFDFSSCPNVDTIWYSQSIPSKIDVTKNLKLKVLVCSGSMASLDLTNNVELISLLCTNNELTELDLSKNVNLEELRCSYNNLSSLDISKNTKLNSVWCNNNKLTELDVTNNKELHTLYVINNPLKENSVSVCESVFDKWYDYNKMDMGILPNKTDGIYKKVSCN